MAGNDVVAVAGQIFDDPERFERVHDIGRRKRILLGEILPVVHRVACQHHGAARGVDAHDLQAAGMAADQMHGDAGRNGAFAVVEFYATGVEIFHQRHHVIDFGLAAKPFVADAAAGGLRHLGVLDVECGVGKQTHVAGMVPMQVGDHDVIDGLGIDAGLRQRRSRCMHEATVAPLRSARGKSGVDHDGSTLAANDPDIEIHRHRPVVAVGHDEILACRAGTRGAVAYGEDFIVRQLSGHRCVLSSAAAEIKRVARERCQSRPAATAGLD